MFLGIKQLMHHPIHPAPITHHHHKRRIRHRQSLTRLQPRTRILIHSAATSRTPHAALRGPLIEAAQLVVDIISRRADSLRGCHEFAR